MKRFDYETAWNEVARPGFETLPANVRALYERTCVVAQNLAQLRSTDMPWPDPEAEGFRQSFREVPAEVLAPAARIVYFYGHWSPKGHSYLGAGGTWKFSKYADQELSERLGLRQPGEIGYPSGASLRIIEGMLRLGWASEWFWGWREIDYATRRNKERVEASAVPVSPHHNRRQRAAWEHWGDAMERHAARLIAQREPGISVYGDLILDTDRYMVEEVKARG